MFSSLRIVLSIRTNRSRSLTMPIGRRNLNLTDTPKPPLRSFGFIVATGFSIIALWPWVLRGESVRSWALAIAVTMFTAGLLFPGILRPVFKIWMAIGEVLGWVNTRIILTLVYYLLIVPIGALLRLTNKDAMGRHF